MPKRKAGLHKDITSIFDGVPIQKSVEPDGSTPSPSQQQPKSTFSRLPILERQQDKKTEQKTTKEEPVKQKPVKTAAGSDAFKSGIHLWQKGLQQIQKKFFNKENVRNDSAKRRKAVAMMLPVLAIVFIFMLSKMLRSPSSQNQAATAGFGPAAAAAGQNGKNSNKLNWQIPQIYPETLRDPMKFGSKTAARKNELVVRGIVFSQDNPSAVVGTTIARAGDKIAGATVIKINSKSVEFEMDGQRWEQEVQQ